MKAIATVSMYDMGAANRNGLRHSQTIEQRKQIIAAAGEQRYVEFTGDGRKYTSGTVHELTANSTPIEREFYDFYRTPRGEFTPAGQSPLLTTHPTLTSNVKFMNFYPFNDIETISPRPLLFISGDQAHSREFSEDAYKRAAEPKELVWVPGAGHRPRRPHSVRQAPVLLQPASCIAEAEHPRPHARRRLSLDGFAELLTGRLIRRTQQGAHLMSDQPTAARKAFGDIAPALADYTDKVLFGDVWQRPGLSPRDRSLITVAALIALYRTNELPFHLKKALENGINRDELIEVITHLAFYSGWPTANSAVTIAKRVFEEVGA
jgi:alkylhydroperoxidase/carboxymuconolactone decarboxylase family protein YurZ